MNCPVCETTNIQKSAQFCPTCGYELSPDLLTLPGISPALMAKERQRIAWAKKLWAGARAEMTQTKTPRMSGESSLNDLSKQVKDLIEIQSQLSLKLSEIMAGNLPARFSELEQKLEEIAAQQRYLFAAIEQKITRKQRKSVPERISELEQRVEAIASQLPNLSATIQQEITNKISGNLIPEIATLDAPVTFLPKTYRSSSIELASELTSDLSSDLSSSIYPAASGLKISQETVSLKIFYFTKVEVSEFGEIINQKELKSPYFSEKIGDSVTLDMVLIPGGVFAIGSPETEKHRHKNEGPQHLVTVPTFFMGKYPVTQAQWEVVMKNNPSSVKGANLPVENVSWHEATIFCQKLSQITGKNYRLPLEAEWEYACRAGTTTPFYFGETITTDLANYNGNYTYGDGPKGLYRGKTTEVGTFPPNAFGLYDMHGNIWEWCQDVWQDSYHNYDAAPTDETTEKRQEKIRNVLRGGSWFDYPVNCRSAYRCQGNPARKYEFFGFRVVCWLPETA
jgi:formylglycine-generating enzyme required for sulfatase activity